MMLNLLLSNSVLRLGDERGAQAFLERFTNDTLTQVKALLDRGYDPLGNHVRTEVLNAAHRALHTEFGDREFEFHYLLLQREQQLHLYLIVDVLPNMAALRVPHVRSLYRHYLATTTSH